MDANGKRIVYTSGSWDLFHIGHLNLLRRSKTLGDILIVGVSTDALIETYKGVPPVIPYEERFAIISAICHVDQVVAQTALTEISQLKALNVDVVTIGDDWKGRRLEGLAWMASQPGKSVVYLDYTPGVSTTGIKQRIIENSYAIVNAQLKRELAHMEEWKKRFA